MKTKVLFLSILLMIAAIPAYAEIGQTIGMIGEGAVGLPIALLKLVGGTLKLVGEVLILPFTIF